MAITNTYEYQKLRGLKRKIELIERKGGCCIKCGYNKNISALEFHHIDPTKKDYQLDVRKLSNSKMEDLVKEVEKCDLLCANCHRETHSPNLEMDKVILLVKDISESVLKSRIINKPTCIDCGCKINYTCKRCKRCNYISRQTIGKPDLSILIKEIEENSKAWCAKKYGVSPKTIRRWII
jgi:hypothetical protein